MTEAAEQCIICLENLEGGPADPSVAGPLPPSARPAQRPAPCDGLVAAQPALSTTNPAIPAKDADKQSDTTTPGSSTGNECEQPHHTANDVSDSTAHIAVLEECGHHLHNECLQAWTAKANSCPICRNSFNVVNVFDRIGGTQLLTYLVADKKQTVEWDPSSWLLENEEEDVAETELDSRPCIVCQSREREDVLLLCDNCDAPYHTYCLGLSAVPRDTHWYCMECHDVMNEVQSPQEYGDIRRIRSRRTLYPRTRGRERQARRHAWSDPWRGAWGQFTESVFEALDIDLEYDDTDDEDLEGYRRAQQLRDRERREYQRWQQRLNIATRAGAREVFQNSLSIPRAPPPPPAPERPRETREELQSWRALERAKEDDAGSPRRKRKASPDTVVQSDQKPERKLKRPRTRRVPQQTVTTTATTTTTTTPAVAGPSHLPTAEDRAPDAGDTAPTFLSSLLQEIKQHPMADEGNARGVSINGRASYVESSPASSPPHSVWSSPVMPTSPSPVERPISPVLPLSSHIEPHYPPANYRPTGSRQHSDTELEGGESRRKSMSQRPQATRRSRSQDGALSMPLAIRTAPRDEDQQKRSERKSRREGSPTLPLEMKENISRIVRVALKPHWSSKKITSQQYEVINRLVSRKLYHEATRPEGASLDDDTKQLYERIATREVGQAVSELKA